MRRLLLLICLSILLLAACNGDDEGDSSDSATTPEATDIVYPTLPPAQTIDISNPNSANIQATATRTELPERANAPTLPPTWTPRMPASPVPPTATETVVMLPTNTPEPIIIPTRPPQCQGFRPDTERNRDTEDTRIGEPVTVYWFPMNGEGYSYVLQLFGPDGVAFFVAEIFETEFTFDGELFTLRNATYFWSAIPYLGDVPEDACGSIGDEIFVGP